MKSTLAKTFFVIPVVYLGVIFSLVFLQFYAGQSFQETHDGLRLSGRYDAGSNNEARTLQEATLAYRGVEFHFDRDTYPMLLNGDDEQPVRLHPIGYTRLDSGFELHLEHDVSLRFRVSGEDGDGMMVQAFLPESVRPKSELLLPYRTVADASVERGTDDTEIAVTYDGSIFALTAPPRAAINAADGFVALRGDVDFQTVRYRRTGTLEDHVVERRFADGQNAVSAAEIDEERRDYIDKAYAGWDSSRFNGGSGTWDMRGGSPRFEEEILVAYLAEAWDRDEFTGAFNQMRRAADQHPDEIGLHSAPFLGNLNDLRPRFLEEDEETTEELRALVNAEDPAVFTTPRVFQFARNRGSTELHEALMEFAERVDYHDVSVEEAVGLYRLAVEHEHLTEAEQELHSRFTAIAEERLYPAVAETEEGFFLETAPGQVDVALSALAGQLLERDGENRGDEQMQHLGRQLLRSVLQLADGEGFLPRVVHPGDERLEGSEGSIGPEALYADITENPAYPRPMSLPTTGVFENAWIYTVGDVVETEITDDQARIRLQYPRNQTFYVIVQNVPPFQRMELFGQTWRNDPAFENYVKGRNYVQESETLLIKYNDDSVEGDIIMFY